MFTSLEYIFLFLIVLSLNTFLKGNIRLVILLISSLYFAVLVSGIAVIGFLFILILYVFLNFILIRYGLNSNRFIIFLNVIVVILTLVFFKYWGIIGGFFNTLPVFFRSGLVEKFIPVGISYLTFQMISYFIDVYNRRIEPERNILRFLLYIVYFPKLTSGPIERSTNFLRQLWENKGFDYFLFTGGLRMFIWGFFCKSVIADRLAPAVSKVFNSPFEFSSIQVLSAALFFTIQIYADFGGYTYMAMGASQMLGIRLTNNFKAPFFSKSISEFWTRWHITLSSWLRDYLFIPLSLRLTRLESGKSVVFKNDMAVYVISSLFTMCICGLWHGPSLTFFIWGFLHGIFLSVSFATRKPRRKILKKTGMKDSRFFLPLLRNLFIFSLIVFSFIFFNAGSLQNSFDLLSVIFSFRGGFDISSLFLMRQDMLIAFASIAFLILVDFLFYNKTKSNPDADIYDVIKTPIAVLLIAVILIFGKSNVSNFIYFKF